MLKWIQHHHNKEYPTYEKIFVNFDEDLKSGVAFAALIKSHYGYVKELKDINISPSNDAQRRQNASAVIKALEEIKV